MQRRERFDARHVPHTRERVIPVFRPYYDEREEQAVAQVLRSGWVGLGPRTEEFEVKFAARVGAKYAVAVNSCTAALHLALKLLDIGPGDEVLVPTITFVSTAVAVQYQSAVARFCDVQPDHLLIDYDDAAARWTSRTRLMIPVLYGGRPLPAPPGGMPVIYDCAHAAGARWNAGGKICCWSFHAVKNLATGDGGMITLDDESLYRRALRLRWLGIDKTTWDRARDAVRYYWEYRIDEVGYKYHMNDLTAAIGLVQLEKLDEMQEIRHRLVRQYIAELRDVPDLEVPQYDENSSWHLLCVRTCHRNELWRSLDAQGIQTSVHYKPLHLLPMFGQVSLPVAEREWERILTLPLFPGLSSSEVSRICDGVRTALTALAGQQPA